MKTDIQTQTNAEKPDDVLADLEAKRRFAEARGSARPCSLKARKHLPWAIAELEKMEKSETDPKLRALWRNAAQLGRESLSPNADFSEPRAHKS